MCLTEGSLTFATADILLRRWETLLMLRQLAVRCFLGDYGTRSTLLQWVNGSLLGTSSKPNISTNFVNKKYILQIFSKMWDNYLAICSFVCLWNRDITYIWGNLCYIHWLRRKDCVTISLATMWCSMTKWMRQFAGSGVICSFIHWIPIPFL
jgi:hypothetical protein